MPFGSHKLSCRFVAKKNVSPFFFSSCTNWFFQLNRTNVLTAMWTVLKESKWEQVNLILATVWALSVIKHLWKMNGKFSGFEFSLIASFGKIQVWLPLLKKMVTQMNVFIFSVEENWFLEIPLCSKIYFYGGTGMMLVKCNPGCLTFCISLLLEQRLPTVSNRKLPLAPAALTFSYSHKGATRFGILFSAAVIKNGLRLAE